MIAGRRVFAAESLIDLRYGLSRLMAIAFAAGLDPRAGDVVLFGGRNRRRLKVLHGDQTGVWVSHKTFFDEEASCRLLAKIEGGLREITTAELAWLLDGRKKS